MQLKTPTSPNIPPPNNNAKQGRIIVLIFIFPALGVQLAWQKVYFLNKKKHYFHHCQQAIFDVKIKNVALDLYIYFVYLCILKSLRIGCCFPKGLTLFFYILCIKRSCVFISFFYLIFFCFLWTERMSGPLASPSIFFFFSPSNLDNDNDDLPISTYIKVSLQGIYNWKEKKKKLKLRSKHCCTVYWQKKKYVFFFLVLRINAFIWLFSSVHGSGCEDSNLIFVKSLI